MSELTVKILGEAHTPAFLSAVSVIHSLGMRIQEGESGIADVAVAPLLTVKVSTEELNRPKYGTLIFHPSPLPYGRGASAIKWAYRRAEPITAACWFWANERLDAGDICEMEIIKIDHTIPPREFYLRHVIPALERTLERCLVNLDKGFIHRVPQGERYSSYDPKI